MEVVVALHKQSVEPVFGIIKQAMGFWQFLLRGLEKTNLEGELVTCASNPKRLAKLKAWGPNTGPNHRFSSAPTGP